MLHKSNIMPTFKLVINKVNTKINSNDKMSVKTEEGTEVNPSGLFQYSEKHLDNLADGCGATDADMMRNAVAQSLDDNYLVIEAEQVVAGEVVLNNKGEKIEDPTAEGGFQVYTKDHMRITNTEIQLGEDAVDYIAEINSKVDLQITMNKRMAKRKSKKSTPVVSAESTADEDLD
jgi:hypothetical protein